MKVPHRDPCQRTGWLLRLRPVAGAEALAWLASGCMTSKIDETRQVATAIQANEAIVLLKKPQIEGVGTEEEFLDCVQEKLGGTLMHPEDGQSGRTARRGRRRPIPDLRRAGVYRRDVSMVRSPAR